MKVKHIFLQKQVLCSYTFISLYKYRRTEQAKS